MKCCMTFMLSVKKWRIHHTLCGFFKWFAHVCCLPSGAFPVLCHVNWPGSSELAFLASCFVFLSIGTEFDLSWPPPIPHLAFSHVPLQLLFIILFLLFCFFIFIVKSHNKLVMMPFEQYELLCFVCKRSRQMRCSNSYKTLYIGYIYAIGICCKCISFCTEESNVL